MKMLLFIVVNWCLSASSVTTGVLVNAVTGLKIQDNTIECLQPDVNQSAIHLSGTSGVEVLGNTIYGVDALIGELPLLHADYTGIRVEQNQNTQVECNTTDNLKTGIRVEGQCGTSNI